MTAKLDPAYSYNVNVELGGCSVRIGGWSASLLAITVATLIALGIGELFLRSDPRFKPPRIPLRNPPEGRFQYFEPHGYRLWPSRSTAMFYPNKDGRNLTIVANRDGFRSRRELQERDARTRIVVLGDSFVFGLGVEENERFTELLEQNEPGWRVDNLGMMGFGTDLMLRTLETVGLKCHPQIVLFCIWTDDLRRVRTRFDGLGFRIPRYELESGRLVSVPYPEPRWWDRLSIAEAIRKVYWNYTDTELRINAAILDRFAALARHHRFAPGLVFLPGASDSPNDKGRRFWLRQYAERNTVALLDLTEVMVREGRAALIEGDVHWNPHGHAIAAAEIHGFLREKVLPSALLK